MKTLMDQKSNNKSCVTQCHKANFKISLESKYIEQSYSLINDLIFHEFTFSLHFTQTSLLMLPLTHTSHNTLVSTCVKAQLKQLTRGKVIAQTK